MHIYILGICGTFMGSLALLAREKGCQVSGADQNVYPPMSTQLAEAGIALEEGYSAASIEAADADLVVIGNSMSRGNPAVEYVLDSDTPYCSGPDWLARYVLESRWVLAVAGTHGKTTTASMLAWILEYAGLEPGFLIGGVPGNFASSARLGAGRHFVVEADEYDSAFFDKRSKFVHYSPRTLVLNNLEFDHADIFDDLSAIQRQFHHLLRTVPSTGKVILPLAQNALQEVVEMGCWSELEYLPAVEHAASADRDVVQNVVQNVVENDIQNVVDNGDQNLEGQQPVWQLIDSSTDQSRFSLRQSGIAGSEAGENDSVTVDWPLCGVHNRANAIAAIAAAVHVGVEPALAAEALCQFAGVKRRLELLATVAGIAVYDDFAHHPTAIAMTLAGLRQALQKQGTGGRIMLVIEARSNTMKLGVHDALLGSATSDADRSWWYEPETDGRLSNSLSTFENACVESSIELIVQAVVRESQAGDCVVVMSNGGFQGIHQLLIDALAKKHH